jgi:hypothetical protein
MFLKVFDTLRDPAYSILNATWKVAVRLVWAEGHEHVGKVLICYSQECSWAMLPFIFQGSAIDTTEVDRFKGACDYGVYQFSSKRW